MNVTLARVKFMAQAGVRAHYTIQQSADRLVAIYNDVIGGRPHTTSTPPRGAAH